MSEEVNEKVAIATTSTARAQMAFDFEWGESELPERLKALDALSGSQASVIRAAGLPASTYKSAQSRGGDMASQKLGALARTSGLSLDYLIWGTPLNARDAACEEARFDLAVTRASVQSGATKRQAQLDAIARQRDLVDDGLQAFMAGDLAESGGSRPSHAPAGYVLILPLALGRTRVGKAEVAKGAPAPIAIAGSWLQQRRINADRLRYIEIAGDAGGASLPANAIVLVDIEDTEPRPGLLFAMDFAGEPQLRRIVRRLDGHVELVHLNPAWPAELVDSAADAPVLGSVCYVFGDFEDR